MTGEDDLSVDVKLLIHGTEDIYIRSEDRYFQQCFQIYPKKKKQNLCKPSLSIFLMVYIKRES